MLITTLRIAHNALDYRIRADGCNCESGFECADCGVLKMLGERIAEILEGKGEDDA